MFRDTVCSLSPMGRLTHNVVWLDAMISVTVQGGPVLSEAFRGTPEATVCMFDL